MNRQEPLKFSSPAISAQTHPNKLLRAISKIILFQSQTFGKSNLKSIMVIKHSGFSEDDQDGQCSPEPDHRARKPSAVSSFKFQKEGKGGGNIPG